MTKLAGDMDIGLVDRVRAGDLTAFGELYAANVRATYQLARRLTPGWSDVDDLVAETWAKVLAALRSGKGPRSDSGFRAYLLTSVRHTAYTLTTRTRRLVSLDSTDDPLIPADLPDSGGDPAEVLCATATSALVWHAFSTLPARWQAVLVGTELHGQAPRELAPRFGLAPNAVAALAMRAREGLRQRFLQAHLRPPVHERCRPTVARLSSWIRNGLGRQAADQVRAHLSGCAQCRAQAAELAGITASAPRTATATTGRLGLAGVAQAGVVGG